MAGRWIWSGGWSGFFLMAAPAFASFRCFLFFTLIGLLCFECYQIELQLWLICLLSGPRFPGRSSVPRRAGLAFASSAASSAASTGGVGCPGIWYAPVSRLILGSLGCLLTLGRVLVRGARTSLWPARQAILPALIGFGTLRGSARIPSGLFRSGLF